MFFYPNLPKIYLPLPIYIYKNPFRFSYERLNFDQKWSEGDTFRIDRSELTERAASVSLVEVNSSGGTNRNTRGNERIVAKAIQLTFPFALFSADPWALVCWHSLSLRLLRLFYFSHSHTSVRGEGRGGGSLNSNPLPQCRAIEFFSLRSFERAIVSPSINHQLGFACDRGTGELKRY